VSDTKQHLLRVPVLLWFNLIRDLYRRGGGRRESGAFLLGKRRHGRDVVKQYICYDDVDPDALKTGIVVIRSEGFSKLWAECKRLGLQVLADVHTHPNDYPTQSESDRTNPMISQAGHIAFILPSFAGTWGWRFKNVAIYEYLGAFRWTDLRGKRRHTRVRFRWW
jgi:proteasome lid subunit RPN8/RPN11